MGSCLSSEIRTAKQDKKEELPKGEEEVVEQTESCPRPESEPVKLLQADGAKKKMVRFKLQEDDDNVGRGSTDHGDSRSGVVRIRVVVTLKELKQILNSENFQYSSVEELVSAMKLKRSRTCKAKTSDGDSWRPALESIPEDH
ncbi:uncharacterized protein LOC121248713 [Juglans microcarpa x Juglans regia]|uniref:uncharacterized protein LOC121248713 n=1 Tax=Juglans microcarpa x Juglans regia TaxID=2249226 RepID=UPI001B7F7917|nr:uncharacterized protein LOC121248713 [Juglans microcarpa x Juglans regia]